ncbi:MAG: AAA family ATPase [Candidatus Cryptobacteroides sp.]
MKYPIGIQSFESLRRDNYCYVDKTGLVYRLAESGKYYFLSRPRRFGKSLLISTFEAYFKGKKELFKGLDIEQLEKDWIKYPVLHLDLNGINYNSSAVLDQVLDNNLSIWEKEYGVQQVYAAPGLRLQNIIDTAVVKTGRSVVLLIDEYDKPIVDNLDNPELADYYKKTLQGFYSVLKAKDGQIRFGFLTGVSKIGKLSVFSGLNNLKDISLDINYSGICGISEKELHYYFDESVSELAEANEISIEQTYDKLKKMYDGYHFSEDSEGMYNPFSLLNTFSSCRFREYWFETGTPTLLVKVMKQTSFDVTTLSDKVVVSSNTLNGMQDIINQPVPLFFQTGYLTIKDYDAEFQEYRLGFPNDEVKNGFLNFIYSYYVPSNPVAGTKVSQMTRALRSGDPDLFMNILSSLFADTSYQLQGNAEKDFQYAMYVIMELVGEYVQAERTTSNGRIDLLLQTKDYIYVIELKVDNGAEAALRQIEEKGYARPFSSDSRKLFKIGVSFSSKDRCITAWKIV